MSGHSKWANIKHRKGAQDAKRAKAFTKVIKELMVAAGVGGADPGGNPRLRSAIQAARAVNLPREKMDRAIRKGAGELDAGSYVENTYEGYGPEGVALLIGTMTDNVNRTVAEVRTTLNKGGGNLGAPGSVAWMFDQKGLIQIAKDAGDMDFMFELAIEAGADDVEDSGDQWHVTTGREDLYAVIAAIEAQGVKTVQSSLVQVPKNTVELTDASKAQKVLALIDQLEDCDDVQNVWANFDLTDDVIAALS